MKQNPEPQQDMAQPPYANEASPVDMEATIPLYPQTEGTPSYPVPPSAAPFTPSAYPSYPSPASPMPVAPQRATLVYILIGMGVLIAIALTALLAVLLGWQQAEPAMAALGEPTPTQWLPAAPIESPAPESYLSNYPRYKDAIPESYVEQLILEGYNRYLEYWEIDGLSQSEVSLVRNGMYALSGKIFEKAVNRDYFSSKSWYTPVAEHVTEQLNSAQRANVTLCVEYEKAMGWR